MREKEPPLRSHKDPIIHPSIHSHKHERRTQNSMLHCILVRTLSQKVFSLLLPANTVELETGSQHKHPCRETRTHQRMPKSQCSIMHRFSVAVSSFLLRSPFRFVWFFVLSLICFHMNFNYGSSWTIAFPIVRHVLPLLRLSAACVLADWAVQSSVIMLSFALRRFHPLHEHTHAHTQPYALHADGIPAQRPYCIAQRRYEIWV